MDANKIKINWKRCVGNTSISDFKSPRCATQIETIMLAVQ